MQSGGDTHIRKADGAAAPEVETSGPSDASDPDIERAPEPYRRACITDEDYIGYRRMILVGDANESDDCIAVSFDDGGGGTSFSDFRTVPGRGSDDALWGVNRVEQYPSRCEAIPGDVEPFVADGFTRADGVSGVVSLPTRSPAEKPIAIDIVVRTRDTNPDFPHRTSLDAEVPIEGTCAPLPNG